MRNTFINCLISKKAEGENVFLLVGDLGYSVVEPFVEKYPNSFFNIGVAEQNMAGIASGMASEEGLVFCYSIANFSTFRCAEQIRNDIDYHCLPVCMVSVGGGVTYGNMGYSHHAIQDYSLMRSLPNMLICSPADPNETKLCIDLIMKRKKPSYLRIHKNGEATLSSNSEIIVPGEPRLIKGDPSSKNAILTTGFPAQGIVFNDEFQEKNFCLYSMPAWGMQFKDSLIKFASKYDKILTIEDHLLDGGFGSWVLECLIGTEYISKIKINGFNKDIVGKVAKEDYLHNLAKLFSLNFN